MTAKQLLDKASQLQDGPVNDPSKICHASEMLDQQRLSVNHFILRAARGIQPRAKWASVVVEAQRIVRTHMGWNNMFAPPSSDMTTDEIRNVLASCAGRRPLDAAGNLIEEEIHAE